MKLNVFHHIYNCSILNFSGIVLPIFENLKILWFKLCFHEYIVINALLFLSTINAPIVNCFQTGFK